MICRLDYFSMVDIERNFSAKNKYQIEDYGNFNKFIQKIQHYHKFVAL